jgi:hypothetical protein
MEFSESIKCLKCPSEDTRMITLVMLEKRHRVLSMR